MILVTGGTGIIGSRIARLLVEADQPVRVLARGLSDWHDNQMPRLRKLGIEVVTGDLRNAQRLLMATADCTAVVNCAGIFKETAADSYASVHVDALESLLAVAKEQGVQRFVQVSCLGASQFSNSNYLRSKWQGEQLVRDEQFYWTIVRTGLIFAPESMLVKTLKLWCGKLPFIPIIGSGLNRMRPIFADDVAACIVRCLFNRDSVGKSYELVGKESYNLSELLSMSSAEISGIVKPSVQLPSALGYRLAGYLEKLFRNQPISQDFIKMMTEDMESEREEADKLFDVNLASFADNLPLLIGPVARLK